MTFVLLITLTQVSWAGQAIDLQRGRLYFDGHDYVGCMDLGQRKLLWAVPLENIFPGGGIVHSGPVVSDEGPVLTGGEVGATYAVLSPKTGALKWRVTDNSTWALGAGAGAVYVYQLGDGLVALDAKTGTRLWNKQMPLGTNIFGGAAPEGSISFYKGRIYTDWRVLSPKSGRVFRYLTWDLTDFVALEGGSLYRVSRDNHVSRIDPISFKTVWQVKLPWRPGWQTDEVLANDEEVVVAALDRGQLWGLDLKTGQARWAKKIAPPAPDPDRFAWGGVNHDGELLYLSLYDIKNQVSIEQAISMSSGESIWSAEIPAGQGRLVSYGSMVYTVTYEDVVYALSRSTGKVLWKVDARKARTEPTKKVQ